MANTIIVKRSSVAGKVPASGDLQVGELAVNLTDRKIYTKDSGGTVVQLGGGSGSGDVVGPSSATDNALARFDGTTGKLIQNSAATLDDSGNMVTNSVQADYTDWDTAAVAPAFAQGRSFWDSGNNAISTYLNASVTLQNGQEMVALVYNGTGATITNGSVVAVNGAQGQRPSIALADADSEALSAPTLGIATQDIANGAEGFVTTFGFVRGLNTSAFTAGQPIYLSQTAGQFTATRPSAPAHTVALGWVIKVNASSGEVFVNISNGWELSELHDVLISSAASGNTLIYDASVGVWKNANLTAGTGISVTNGAGSISIANTGVTSVSGTAPISSSGGATPAISISQATTTTNGYLSSTDWNTFNNKQAALVSGTNIKTVNGTSLLGSGDVSVGVTSVTGTSPVSSSGGATPAISLASGYGDTQNPYASKTANYFLAAPNGVAGVPTFRAIVAADIPTLNQNTTGTASNVTGTVAVANGGTGSTTAAGALTNLGAYPSSNPSGYTSNTGTVTSITAGTGLSGGTITTSGTISLANTAVTAGSYTSANITVDAQGRITSASNGGGTATTATNLAGGSASQIPYQTGAGATSFIANGSSGQFLKSNGTSAPSWANVIVNASYLIVAGGGGGGAATGGRGGGGGAGGVLSGNYTMNAGTTYSFVVGGGGAGGSGALNSTSVGSNGSNSTAFGLTAIGGGGGQGGDTVSTAQSGGSGGGAHYNGAPGSGTAGQGNSGGSGTTGANFGSGGGGGWGAVGGNGSGSNGGNGGAGSTSSITGSATTYAGGGGGQISSGTGGTGGSGGGGNGGNPGGGSAGSANTGGGGGGRGDGSAGWSGGSGVVIISIPTSAYTGVTTGSPTVTTSGSNTILKFTASGSYTA